MVPRTADMDTDNGSILIRVPLAHLGMEAETEKWPDTLSARIYDSSIVRSPVSYNAVSAWKAQGSFKNRVVVFDDKAQLWRVYMAPDRRWTWLYFDKHPEEIISNPDKAYVADCIVSSSKIKVFNSARCEEKVRYKNLISNITLSGKHFSDRDEIYKAYIKMLQQWDKAIDD